MSTNNEEQGKVEKMMQIADELGSMNIEEAMFFVPDDFRNLEGKGRWILFVEKGKLVKQKEKEKKKE